MLKVNLLNSKIYKILKIYVTAEEKKAKGGVFLKSLIGICDDKIWTKF